MGTKKRRAVGHTADLDGRKWVGRTEKMGRPTECYTGRWLELVESVGSAQALAEVLGVSIRNMRRYAKGEVLPHRLAQMQINLIASARGVGAIYP